MARRRAAVWSAVLMLFLCMEPVHVVTGHGVQMAQPVMEIKVQTGVRRVYEEDSVSVRLRNILPAFLMLCLLAGLIHYQAKQSKVKYQNKLTPTMSRSSNLNRDGNIVVAIPTMRRYKAGETSVATDQGEVLQLVSTLYNDMPVQEAEHVQFLLYNVDPLPREHVQVGEVVRTVPNVEVVIKPRPSPESTTSNESSTTDNPITSTDTTQSTTATTATTAATAASSMASWWATSSSGETVTESWQKNETMDATNLLEVAQHKAQYVLFLEDDVIPTSTAISKIFKYIRDATEADIDDWFMIDLYTPLSPWSSPMPGNMERFEFKCCTQAMLLRSSRLPELIAFLRLHPARPFDEVIAQWVKHDTDERKVYAMFPNPFDHRGAHSTNPTKSSSTIEHRSLQFDNSGPMENSAAVSAIFGGKSAHH